MKSFKGPPSTSDKSRSNIVDIERQVYSNQASTQSPEIKLRLLSDNLVNISKSFPELYSILVLISEEYQDIFKKQKMRFISNFKLERRGIENELKDTKETVEGNEGVWVFRG